MKVIDFLWNNWAIITGAIALAIYIITVVVHNFFPEDEPELDKVIETTTESLSATGSFVASVEALKRKP